MQSWENTFLLFSLSRTEKNSQILFMSHPSWISSWRWLTVIRGHPCVHLYIGWIPGFLGFSNSGNETWIWIAQIVELQISFSIIPNSSRFPENRTSKIKFSNFLLRGRLSRWTCCARKVHIFWYQKVIYLFYGGWNCVGRAKIKLTCRFDQLNLLEI